MHGAPFKCFCFNFFSRALEKKANLVNARRQEAVNRLAIKAGAGVGTAEKDGVPGTNAKGYFNRNGYGYPGYYPQPGYGFVGGFGYPPGGYPYPVYPYRNPNPPKKA